MQELSLPDHGAALGNLLRVLVQGEHLGEPPEGRCPAQIQMTVVSRSCAPVRRQR